MDTIPETENVPVTLEISSEINMDKKAKTGAKSVAFHKLGRDSEVFNFEFPDNIPCFVSSVDFIGVISITGS
jgi:hypothetical protein